jgi:outer membrane protein OmpA-like peptidoglycan-associated protein
MSQQGTLAKGFAAFAGLCAVAVWAVGPVETRPATPIAAGQDKPALMQPVTQPITMSTPLNPPLGTLAAALPSPLPVAPSNATTVAAPTLITVPSSTPLPVASASAPPAEASVIAQTAIPLSTTSPTPAIAASSPEPTAQPKALQIEADIAVQLRNKVIEFESKSDQLTPRGKEVVEGLLPLFNQAPQARFLIEGHTDSWGDKAYNQALSERRARAVKAYLASKGLEAARFEFKGMGDVRPIADNATTAGSRKNRRIEFKAL